MGIDNLTLDFPYNNLYPEQHHYMAALKESLDNKGHCLLQMPPGTGKTVALLSLITSYHNQYSRTSSPPINLIYCTPTVHEIAKTLNELQLLYNYQGKNYSPDYLAPGIARFGHVLVCTHRYMLDPKLALDGIISGKELGTETVIVFDDEASNLDNECIEALSVCVTRQTLEKVSGEIDTLMKLSNQAGRSLREEDWPGNIRRAEYFLRFLQRLVRYLQGRLGETTRESLAVFLSSISNKAAIDQNSMRFCYKRLRSLMLTLAIDKDELLHTRKLCSFAELIADNYDIGGFSILVEQDVLHIRCLDASLAIKPVFERFQSVVITSGTLSSPTDHLYPRLLGFNPVVNRSFKLSMPRDCICPMVVNPCNGSSRDQARSYGKLLLEMVSVVPDGILCSFESYLHMDGIISAWNDTGILKEVMQHKLQFIETQDVVETTLAVENYRRACDCGRGAVFLSVAGGKVARGIAFDRHYGRLVLLFGIPFYQKNNNNTATETTNSRILCARLEFLRDRLQIKEGDFLTFDSARQAAQCVDLGRVLHSKADYGMMIFADDKRYSSRGACSKLLPGWIVPHLRDAHLNLSTDKALHVVRDFLGKMTLPPSHDRRTRLSREDLDDDQMIY